MRYQGTDGENVAIHMAAVKTSHLPGQATDLIDALSVRIRT